MPAYSQEGQSLQKTTVVKNDEIQGKVITDNPDNPLGTAYAENKTKKAETAVETNDYVSAKKTLNEIKETVFDATEYHTELFMTLRKTENATAQAEIERNLAIKFASLRDRILFLEAKIYIHDSELNKAVKNLVETVKSQPDTELGFKAYKLLQKIGFTYGVDTIKIKTDVIEVPNAYD